MNIIFIQILFLFQLISVELKEKTNADSSKESDNSNNKGEINELLELNDSNFDLIIQNGKNNRWLILFYLETCYHCYRARTVINRILELKDYKIINNIKFASIEIGNNTKINIRFNISQVPYIVLVENNTMIEFDLYANEKNLVNFIETNFSNVVNDTKPFPKRNIFKYYYKQFENSLKYVLDQVNNYLKSKNINFKFNAITFIIGYTILCFAFWIIVILLFMKCFGSKKNVKKNILKNNDKNKSEENAKIDEKAKTNINDINENEDMKKIREEKKEEEFKEKNKDNIDNNDNNSKEFKKGRRKKKKE